MSHEINIKDIRQGDYFTEFDGYRSAMRFIAIEHGYLSTNPDTKQNLWVVRGLMLGSGRVIEFSVDEKYPHYGPKLFSGKEVPYNGVTYPEGNDE